jgi:SpoVK/Ycf46/Vps4 family AAA+-type ATPase
MQLWDEVKRHNLRITIFGATNRPQDIDSAIQRRFERAMMIGLPDHAARMEIFKKISKNVNIDLTLFNETIKLTKNLYDILQSYKSKPLPNYKPALHLIAAIAKKVCTELNSDPNFSSTMKDLLSRSNLIQVNSNIKIVGEDKQDCQFTSFKVKYPPLFVGNIIADSSGEYSATEIKGRISFKIP